MNFLKLQMIGFLLLAIVGCHHNDVNKNDTQFLKAYYYPVDELKEGLVYVYENELLDNQPDYWLYKTIYDEAGDQFLVGTQYNSIFEQTQISREWIVADGTILKDHRFLQQDSSTGKSISSVATIKENIIFPFKAVDNDSLAYRFQLSFAILPDTANYYEIIRDRQFDKYLKYEWQGKAREAVQFKIKEYISVQNNTEGGNWDMESNIKEIYVKGIGLVFKSSDNKSVPYRLKLKERMSSEKFETLQPKN